MNNSIVIIDPSAEQAGLLKTILESAGFGYRCRTAPDLSDMPSLLDATAADILLVDQDVADRAALRQLEKMKRAHRGLRILVLAAEVTAEQYRRVQEHALDGFCLKGDDYPGLIDSIEQTIS